jgi:hypothetical protein
VVNRRDAWSSRPRYNQKRTVRILPGKAGFCSRTDVSSTRRTRPEMIRYFIKAISGATSAVMFTSIPNCV